ncbi:MAG TPA: NADP-dependent oxidoreductase [Stellaceae bacterium]|nr:NADP-dependent oxidoreductase [Stellaceae bacterium]
MTENRRFKLIRRPHGIPVAEDFRLDRDPTPALEDGQFLIHNHYASLDPAIRGWMADEPSYLPPIPLGEPVRATTVGEIVESRSAAFPVGKFVVGLNAIEDYSVGRSDGYTSLIDPSVAPSLTHFLSAMGAVGLTGYFGLLEIGRPKPGDTVLVTGAAGAVGSMVGQIAKIKGCRAVGIAGGAAKCQRVTRDYGYDAAIDYRGKTADQISTEIAAACPKGVDVIFENVGGVCLDAGLMNINVGARVALCGLISEYNSTGPRHGTRNLWQLIVKSATIRGFLVPEFRDRFAEGAAAIAGWIREGRLRVDEHVETGIENAHPAFVRLFHGTNEGKMLLKLGSGG